MGNPEQEGDRMRTRTVSFLLAVLMALGSGCASMQQRSESSGVWRGTFSSAQTWSVAVTLRRSGAKLEAEEEVVSPRALWAWSV